MDSIAHSESWNLYVCESEGYGYSSCKFTMVVSSIVIFSDNLNIYHMKRLLFYFLPGLIFLGCSKSQTVKPKMVLTGTYVSYKEVDTLYTAFIVADGIETITVYIGSGDSVYNYPGTVYANSGYTNTPSDNPAPMGGETITFNSSSTATLTRTAFVPTNITYDLNAGTFNDGHTDTRERIVVINANTVELITNPIMVDNQPNTSGFMTATYYRKQ
jgi:hypothetical protein